MALSILISLIPRNVIFVILIFFWLVLLFPQNAKIYISPGCFYALSVLVQIEL